METLWPLAMQPKGRALSALINSRAAQVSERKPLNDEAASRKSTGRDCRTMHCSAGSANRLVLSLALALICIILPPAPKAAPHKGREKRASRA